MLGVSAAFLSAFVQANVIVQQKQTYGKFPTIPKVGQPHRRDTGDIGQWFLEKNKRKKIKKRGEATWSSTHQSVNSGSFFPPTGSDQGLQVVNRRSRTISPTRRPRGSVVFRWGRACRGRQSAVSRERHHVRPSGQSCLLSIGKSMLIHSKVKPLLCGLTV